MMGGSAYGRETSGGRTFNPFDNYFAWVERRDAPRPVHQEFANLRAEDRLAEAQTFLETYGPLDAAATLEDREGRQAMNVEEFWAEQEVFAFSYQLVEALRGDDTERLQIRFLGAVRWTEGRTVTTQGLLDLLRHEFNVRPESQPGASPDDPAHEYAELVRERLVEAIRNGPPTALRQHAKSLLATMVTVRLREVHPALCFEPDPSSQVSQLATWDCSTLREAIWMMLFLDVLYGRRIVRCDHCGQFFADAKENVRFCSDACEKKNRNLRWWREHGQEWRKRRRKAKTSQPGTSERRR